MDKINVILASIQGQRVYIDTNIFVYFLEKYDQLEKQLFDSALTQQTPMLKKIRAAHAEFPHGGINYLKNAFDAALLFYFDKFNMEQLDEAAVHFEHFFFTERLKKYSLRATLVKNLLSTANDNGRNNPFYLIDRKFNRLSVLYKIADAVIEISTMPVRYKIISEFVVLQIYSCFQEMLAC